MSAKKCAFCAQVEEQDREWGNENEEEGEGEVEEEEEEERRSTTEEETDYSSDNSELPDWDSENYSFRHLSWWEDRFKADREEREGCPLAPELAVVISEDWTKSNEGGDEINYDKDQA